MGEREQFQQIGGHFEVAMLVLNKVLIDVEKVIFIKRLGFIDMEVMFDHDN